MTETSKVLLLIRITQMRRNENLSNNTIHDGMNMNQINGWREEYNIYNQSLQQLKQECEFFDISIDIPLLQIIDKEISLYESSWLIYSQFIKEMEGMQNELWVSFRIRLLDFQDFIQLWTNKIKNIQKENKNKNNTVINTVIMHLKHELKQFEDIWPLLRCISGELFETEHWNILFYKLGFCKKINISNLTFGNLLSAKDNMIKHKDTLKHLAHRAQGKVTIRQAIQKLQVWIDSEEFDITKMNQICLIRGWKDLLIKIGDQLSLLSSLKESPYFESFSDQVLRLEEKFIFLDESLRYLNEIQRKWIYLQPIFSRGALPKEQARCHEYIIHS